MRLSEKCSVNPIAWKDKTFDDFNEWCKGKVLSTERKKLWDEIKKHFPKKKVKKVDVKPIEEGGE